MHKMKIHKSSGGSSVGSASPDHGTRTPSPPHNEYSQPLLPQNFALKDQHLIKRENAAGPPADDAKYHAVDHFNPHHNIVNPAYILSRRESIDAVIQAELAADRDTEEIGPEYYYARQNLQQAQPTSLHSPNSAAAVAALAALKSRHPSNGAVNTNLDQKLAALNAAIAVSLPQSNLPVASRSRSPPLALITSSGGQNLQHQPLISTTAATSLVVSTMPKQQLNSVIRYPSGSAVSNGQILPPRIPNQQPLNFSTPSNINNGGFPPSSPNHILPVTMASHQRRPTMDSLVVAAVQPPPPNVKMELGLNPVVTVAPVAQTLSQIMQNKIKVILFFPEKFYFLGGRET